MKSKLFLAIISSFFLVACGDKGEVKVVSSDEQCTLEDVAKNGFDVSNALTSKGIRNFDNVSGCFIDTCQEKYELGDDKTCQPILCSIENSGLTNLTAVTGDLVNGCFATACSWGHFLDEGVCLPLQCDPVYQYIDMNSCADHAIVGASLNFVPTISNSLENDVILAGTALVKEIAFYSDSQCTIESGPRIPISTYNKKVTVPVGDGLRVVYAKFHNGTQSSECLSSSITIDQTSPNLTIDYPTSNQVISSSTVEVRGQCDDINLGGRLVNVSLDGQSVDITCSDGTYSATLNITKPATSGINIPMTAIVRLRDIVDNETVKQLGFSSNICSNFENLVGDHCEPKDIEDPRISFSRTHTMSLSETVSLEPTKFAQTVSIYNNASCSGAPVITSPFSNDLVINIPAGDGVKYVSAIFMNETKTSSCVTDSIILDQTPPTLSINPINNIYEENIIIENSVNVEVDLNEALSSLSLYRNETLVATKTGLEPGVSTFQNVDLTPVSVTSGANSVSFRIVGQDLAGNIRDLTGSTIYERRKLVNFSVYVPNNIYGRAVITQKNDSTVVNTLYCEQSVCNYTFLNNFNFDISFELKTNGKFTSFSGDCSESLCSLANVQDDKSITLNFEPAEYIVVTNDTVAIQQDSSRNILFSELLANDTALVANQNQLTISAVSSPIGGTISLNSATSSISFTPNVKTGENASFVYTVRDTANNKTKTGTVTVNVTHLPEREALVYDLQDSSYLNDMLNATPPTMEELFNTWGYYESRNSGSGVLGGVAKATFERVSDTNKVNFTIPYVYDSNNKMIGPILNRVAFNQFWENRSEMLDFKATYMPGSTPTQYIWANNTEVRYLESTRWKYDPVTERVIQELNSVGMLGLVSPKSYDSYDLEVTIASTNADDDVNGVLLALTNENGVNHHLTFVFNPNSGQAIVHLNYANNVGGYKVLASYKDPDMDILTPLANQAAQNNKDGILRSGWVDVGYVSAKVKRRGDIFEIWFTDWASNEYLENLKFTIDLNSTPELQKFKGPKKYGFINQSQSHSYFYNIKFEASGELKESKLFDLGNLQSYDFVNNSWESSSVSTLDIAEQLGYPRCIYNPKTGKRFYINISGNTISSVQSCPN